MFKVGDRVRINWEQVLINGQITHELSMLYRYALINAYLSGWYTITEVNGDRYSIDGSIVKFYENELIGA